MSNEKYAYIRVSSVDQNEERQRKTMIAMGVPVENIFCDKFSGKNMIRPEYQALKERTGEGDTIIFDSITRLSRNYYDTKEEYEYFLRKGVYLEFVKEPILNTPKTKVDDIVQVALADAILSILAAFAQKEREDIKLRQAEGIVIAKANGKYRGRKPSLVPGGKDEIRMKAIIQAYQSGTSWEDIRKLYKVGNGTIQRILRDEGLL
ncbi:recombinase family protein [Lysinibacillus fusiformis]|uniref:recombinase family protein n=1 Tax=Lysinibacillus fusiformis TaxID=28031 RepID=UPI002E1E4879|nr:recombinase family protein [Lysinibacillus fusiformis]